MCRKLNQILKFVQMCRCSWYFLDNKVQEPTVEKILEVRLIFQTILAQIHKSFVFCLSVGWSIGWLVDWLVGCLIG